MGTLAPVQLWTHLPEARPTQCAVAARTGDVVGADVEGRVWGLGAADGQVRWSGSVVAPARAVAISSDGRRTYALGERGHFAIFDEAGAVVKQEKLQPETAMMDLEPGGQFLLMSDGVSSTWQRDLRTHQMQRRPLAMEAAALRIIPIRNTLVVILPTGTAAITSIDGDVLKRIRGDGRLLEMAVAAHGNLLAFAAGSAGVIFTDGEGDETSRLMLDDGTSVLHVECDAAGSRFAVADHCGRVLLLGPDGQVLWHRPADASGPVSGIRISGSGKRLVVISSEGGIHAYDLEGVASAMRSKEPLDARHGSGAGEKGPLWTIPAFGGIRANYLGAAAISPDAALLGFLDRDIHQAKLLDIRGTPLASAALAGSDLAIAFVDTERLIVTGAEGVLSLTASSKKATMGKTPPDDLTGLALSPGVPFALGWTSLGSVVALGWDGAVRWSGSAGGTRITHGVLSPERSWILNAAGAVAELDLNGKLLSKSTPLTAPASAATGWGNFLAIASGREVIVLGPGGKTLRTLKTRGAVAALMACGDHLVVRDGEDRLTIYNLVGLEEATGGPWPGRWALTESAELGGIVLLQAEVDLLTCHRLGVGVAWRVKMEEPIVDVEASADGRFCVVLDGPRMSLWAIGSATLPETRANYLEL